MQTEDSKPRIMETASGTTSPDNSNSGPFAYVITVITIGALILLSATAAGICSIVLAAASESASQNNSSLTVPFQDYGNGNGYTDDLENMDIRDFLDLYGNGYGSDGYGRDQSSNSSSQQNSGSASVAEVLDFDIAPYGQTINDGVSANAYAGVPSEVHGYVRSVVSTDRDYTTKLVSALNYAAGHEDERSAKINEALAVCDEAKSTIEAIEVPDVSGDNGSAAKDQMSNAKNEAARRWELMKTEISMLKDADKVNTQRLWSTNDEILEATEQAGNLLEEAMETASNR